LLELAPRLAPASKESIKDIARVNI
jgi:hypothetical protein